MIGVIGLGYVGITSYLGFHKLGADVIGIDIDANVIEKLTFGTLHIFDNDLQQYLSKNFSEMLFSTDIEKLRGCEDVFICVPTNNSKGRLDLETVHQVIQSAANLGAKNIWVRSTIDDPLIFDKISQENINIMSFPEFLREGRCWEDFFDPPLLILGGEDLEGTEVFRILNDNFKNLKTCNAAEAVTVKMLCNAFHALKIAFANEILNLLDPQKVMEILTQDKKLNISKMYLKPGLPFGGPCLPKDTIALDTVVKGTRESSIFSAIIDSNEYLKSKYANAIINMEGGVVGFHGYEFKQNTGDIRSSPILDIARLVAQQKSVILCSEMHPVATKNISIVDYNVEKISELSTLEELKQKCDFVLSYTEPSRDNLINWDDLDVTI